MNKTIEFFVAGIPKAQPRVKARCINGRGSVYTPTSADDWKSLIAIEARKHLPTSPIDAPISLELYWWLARPKWHYRSNGNLRADAPQWHTCRPDIDNLAKAVMDILTAIGMWRDDALVYRALKFKLYARATEQTGVTIRIQT
jgi:Holliday junction resolvase RusA-like endonuclease